LVKNESFSLSRFQPLIYPRPWVEASVAHASHHSSFSPN